LIGMLVEALRAKNRGQKRAAAEEAQRVQDCSKAVDASSSSRHPSKAVSEAVSSTATLAGVSSARPPGSGVVQRSSRVDAPVRGQSLPTAPAAEASPGAAVTQARASRKAVASGSNARAAPKRDSGGGERCGSKGESSPPARAARRAEPETRPAPARPVPFTVSAAPGRELSELQRVERAVKSILNKLTRERFEKLYAQLLDCLAQTGCRTEVIKIIAREVFAKALVQHNFIEMYADVCERLHAELHGVKDTFRRALLEQCQKSFNDHLDPPRIDSNLDYEEKFEELMRYKTKMLGNVRLIGELLVRRMLSGRVLFLITDELLSIDSEEALETLSVFLTTIGASFDTTRWPGHPRLEEVFMKVQRLREDTRKTKRTRVLLQDVLDKRLRKWHEDLESQQSQQEESGSWRSRRVSSWTSESSPGAAGAGGCQPRGRLSSGATPARTISARSGPA